MPNKKINFSKEQLQEIKTRYEKGESLQPIADTFGCSRDVIKARLVEQKAKIRKAGKDKVCNICKVKLNKSNTTWYRQKNYIYKCNDCVKIEKAIEANERSKISPNKLKRNSKKYRDKQKKEKPKLYSAQQMYSSASKRAKALKLPFNIDSNYIESICPKNCPVLGMAIKYGGGDKEKNSASLDKIIPNKGYVKGNVQVISQLANTMKNEASPTELLKFAKWINNTY
jgi:hypothetical protein